MSARVFLQMVLPSEPFSAMAAWIRSETWVNSFVSCQLFVSCECFSALFFVTFEWTFSWNREIFLVTFNREREKSWVYYGRIIKRVKRRRVLFSGRVLNYLCSHKLHYSSNSFKIIWTTNNWKRGLVELWQHIVYHIKRSFTA